MFTSDDYQNEISVNSEDGLKADTDFLETVAYAPKQSFPSLEEHEWLHWMSLFPSSSDNRPGLFFLLAHFNHVHMEAAAPALLPEDSIKNAFLSLPSPFNPRRKWYQKPADFISGLIQTVLLIPEIVLYVVAIFFSTLYAKAGEVGGLIGILLFFLVDLLAQAIFCAANAIGYARKLLDGVIHLNLRQILQNALRLLPVAIALCCYFIPGLQPVGMAITAFAGKFLALVGSTGVGIGIMATVGLLLWQAWNAVVSNPLIETCCKKPEPGVLEEEFNPIINVDQYKTFAKLNPPPNNNSRDIGKDVLLPEKASQEEFDDDKEENSSCFSAFLNYFSCFRCCRSKGNEDITMSDEENNVKLQARQQ